MLVIAGRLGVVCDGGVGGSEASGSDDHGEPGESDEHGFACDDGLGVVHVHRHPGGRDVQVLSWTARRSRRVRHRRPTSRIGAGEPHVRGAGRVGVPDVNTTSFSWAIVPPTPTIVPPTPANPTNLTSATFTFTDAQTGVGFKCALDGGSFSFVHVHRRPIRVCRAGITRSRSKRRSGRTRRASRPRSPG